MTASAALQHRISLERRILRKICSSPPASISIPKAKTLLKKYTWRDPDNRVVFESLCGLSSSLTSAQLREQLPAQATRQGFPDVDWENYFAQEDNADAADVARLIDQLLSSK